MPTGEKKKKQWKYEQIILQYQFKLPSKAKAMRVLIGVWHPDITMLSHYIHVY